MAGWNNKRCCCGPNVSCEEGTVDICCLTLQVSTWARALPAYAERHDPDTFCGSVVSPYPHNNYCGSVSSRNACDSLPAFRIYWGIQTDGTVKLVMDIFSTVDDDGLYVPPVHHEVTGLNPDTWYLAPTVFTLSGLTYTIDLCPDPHTHFPEWPLTDVFYELRDVTGAIRRSTGNLLCGDMCDPTFLTARLRWRYSIYTDQIKITIFMQVRTGPFSLANYNGEIVTPYDDGNWADADYTTDLTAPGVADRPVSVVRVDSCVIPPPPEDCDPYLCFPLCVVNTCPADPGTINASAVFVTANDGITDYTGTALWDDISSTYSFVFSLSLDCGALAGTIQCDGADIKVHFDLFDGTVHTLADYTVSWVCVDGDVTWTTPDLVSGITCSLSITLWTNNGGA